MAICRALPIGQMLLDREWSSGFVYEIANGNAEQNESISVEAPRLYWQDRREPDPE